MKKILLIALMAIFTTGVFAANGIKLSKPTSENTAKKKGISKNQKVNHDFNTCSQKASFSMDCGGGRTVEFAVVTLSYDCETGRVINSDVWQSGKTCSSQQELQMVD